MKKSERGMTLVEVVIAMAISSLIILGVIKLNDISGDTRTNLEERSSLNTHFLKIKTSIYSERICDENFVGLILDKTSEIELPELIMNDLGIVVKQGPYEKINIEKITLRYQETMSEISKEKYQLSIYYSGSSFKSIKKSLPLFFERESTGEIKSCETDSGNDLMLASELVCKELGGEFINDKCNFENLNPGWSDVCEVGNLRFNATTDCPELCNSSAEWVSLCVGSGNGTSLTASGSTHTEEECVGFGGSVVSNVDGTMCKIPSYKCPSGWSSTGWSTTEEVSKTLSFSNFSCNYSAFGYPSCKGNIPDNISVPGVSKNLTSGSHSWAKVNPFTEISSCYQPIGCEIDRSPNCEESNYSYLEKNIMESINWCSGHFPRKSRLWLQNAGGGKSNGVMVTIGTHLHKVGPLVTEVGCK